MDADPADAFDRDRLPSKPGTAGAAHGPVRVFVALNCPASDAVRERLNALGLTITGEAGSTLFGRADAADLAAVRTDPSVREVEVSVPLKPHAGR